MTLHPGVPSMKLRLATLSAALIGFVLVGPTSARATTIRTGSGYGQISGAQTDSAPITGTAEYLICHPDTSTFPSCTGGTDDLVLQMLAPLAGPLQIVVPNFDTSSLTSGTTDFGLLNCGQGTTDFQLTTVCTPTTQSLSTCEADLAVASVSLAGAAATIALPASCTGLTNATFYFDQTAPGGFASLGNTTPAPEPGSLALLVLGLFSVCVLFRCRAHA